MWASELRRVSLTGSSYNHYNQWLPPLPKAEAHLDDGEALVDVGLVLHLVADDLPAKVAARAGGGRQAGREAGQ